MPVQLTDAQRRTVLLILAKGYSPASVPGRFASVWPAAPKITMEDVNALSPMRGVMLRPGEDEFFKSAEKTYSESPEAVRYADLRRQVIELSGYYDDAKDRGDARSGVLLLAEIRAVGLPTGADPAEMPKLIEWIAVPMPEKAKE